MKRQTAEKVSVFKGVFSMIARLFVALLFARSAFLPAGASPPPACSPTGRATACEASLAHTSRRCCVFSCRIIIPKKFPRVKANRSNNPNLCSTSLAACVFILLYIPCAGGNLCKTTNKPMNIVHKTIILNKIITKAKKIVDNAGMA